MQIGESFVGAGRNAAHINTVLGERQGPVGAAWASSLASPSAGYRPFRGDRAVPGWPSRRRRCS